MDKEYYLLGGKGSCTKQVFVPDVKLDALISRIDEECFRDDLLLGGSIAWSTYYQNGFLLLD
jgi:hypothetical protein